MPVYPAGFSKSAEEENYQNETKLNSERKWEDPSLL